MGNCRSKSRKNDQTAENAKKLLGAPIKQMDLNVMR